VEQDQNRFPHSSGLNAGETTSPTMEPFAFIKLRCRQNFSTGTSFATGLPRLVISMDSRFD
jgi:hypothetical protein